MDKDSSTIYKDEEPIEENVPKIELDNGLQIPISGIFKLDLYNSIIKNKKGVKKYD